MKSIRNMRELKMMKKQLQYKEQLFEKEMVGSSAGVLENLGDQLRDFAFEFGMRLATRFITGHWKHKHDKDDED